MINVMEARKNLYRFLSQMYLMEVDGSMLSQLKLMSFPEESGNELLDEGYAKFAAAVKDLSEENLDELAADYAKTFLAAGDAQGNAAFPYESVYTNKRRLVNRAARVDVAAAYAEYGLGLGNTIFKIPEDHISAELEFMAYLCEKWDCASDDAKGAVVDMQKKFFKEHLLNWSLMFCADAEKYADTDFYKGIAKITQGFIQEEKAFLNRI